jgi:lysophospholipase L1-like esterase
LIAVLRAMVVVLLLGPVFAGSGCGDADRLDSPLRFLALGDSYTVGVGIEDAERWPEQMSARLRDDGVSLETHIIAVSGWRVADLLAGMDEVSPTPDYDLVTVFIGSNDNFAGHSTARFEGEISELLDRAIALARGQPGRVLVIGMPDWSRTPQGRSYRVPAAQLASIDTYNEILERSAASRGASFVPLLALSRSYEPGERLFVPDGLHPNAELSARWADAVYEPAARILALPSG